MAGEGGQRDSSAPTLGQRGGCLGTLVIPGPHDNGDSSEGPFLFYIAQIEDKDGLGLGEGALEVGASSLSSPEPLGCPGTMSTPFWGAGWDAG